MSPDDGLLQTAPADAPQAGWLDYEAMVRPAPHGPPWRLALALLYPANAIVLATVVLLLAVIPGLLLLTFGGAFPVGLIVAGVVAIVAGHYVNVVDETGPEAFDEMPTVARSVSFSEDVFQPLMRLLLALGVCFWPMLGVMALADWRPSAAAVALLIVPLGLAGAALFPAVLLTIVCGGGGTLQNLHPIRLWRVITLDRRTYAILTAGLLPAAVAAHALAALLFTDVALGLLGGSWITPLGPILPPAALAAIGLAMLMVGVHLAHLSAWWMGRHYRRFHEGFGWVLQRHERAIDPAQDTGVATEVATPDATEHL